MAIVWITTKMEPQLIEPFRNARWEIKAFTPLELLSCNPLTLGDSDIVVVEAMDRSSLSLCEEICRQQIAPVLAIVPDLAYAQAALESGTNDFLLMPVNPIEALLRVRKLTRASHVIRVGDLEIDLAAKRVSRSGNSVRLSPVEFRLLACLAKRVGQLVNHVSISTEVWGWEAERGPLAQVKSYIGRVRRKIEPDLNDPQYIISVPREGYRLRNQRQWKADRREAVRSIMMQ